jgi:hypothetical protein
MGKSSIAEVGIEKLNLNRKARITENKHMAISMTKIIQEGVSLLKKNIILFF